MTLYRIDRDPRRCDLFDLEALDEMLSDGVLVPVEPCEHGNYARHLVSDDPYLSPTGPWCPGAGIGGGHE